MVLHAASLVATVGRGGHTFRRSGIHVRRRAPGLSDAVREAILNGLLDNLGGAVTLDLRTALVLARP